MYALDMFDITTLQITTVYTGSQMEVDVPLIGGSLLAGLQGVLGTLTNKCLLF